MPSHSPHKVVVVHKQSASLGSLLTILLSVLLIVAGAVGLVLVQQPLQETQDTRSEASVATGLAVLQTNPADNSNFRVNQEAKIDLTVDTDGIQTSEITLVFSILTETTGSIIIQTYSDTGLEITQQEIEQIDDGLLISFKARPNSGTFSSSDPRRIASVIFTPTRTGEVKLSFDAEKSTIYKANTSPAEDLLKTVQPFTFNIISGDTAVKSCNESCTSNAQCPVNHRCYENRCRLVTNLSSTSCSNPPDQGLQRQCNEYCADTRECASGFSCFFNRCRRPDNPDSENCALSSAATQQAIADNCNDSCTSNADCAVNMRCYQGACRLASNVSSTSCSPATKKTVSVLYGNEKGGPEASPLPAATLRPSATGQTSTSSGSATGSATVSPRPTASPSLAPVASPSFVPIPTPEPTNPITDLIERFGITLPLAAIGLGFVLLLIVIILTIANQFKKRSSAPPVLQSQKAAEYESQLQSKIQALQQQEPKPATPITSVPSSVPPAPPAPAPSNTPSMTPPPSTLRPQPPVASPVVPPSPTPPPVPAAPSVTPAQPPAPSSSMMDRMKQKGVFIPGQQPPNNQNPVG